MQKKAKVVKKATVAKKVTKSTKATKTPKHAKIYGIKDMETLTGCTRGQISYLDTNNLIRGVKMSKEGRKRRIFDASHVNFIKRVNRFRDRGYCLNAAVEKAGGRQRGKARKVRAMAV